MQYLKEQVRSRILASARQEFLESGYSRASIRNIADNSGISLGNIYRYFTDKEALFVAVVDDFVNASIEFTDKNFSFDVDAMERYATELLDFLLLHKDDLNLLMSGPRSHYERYFNSKIDAYASALSSYIEANCPTAYQSLAQSNIYHNVCASFMHGICDLAYSLDDDTQRRQKELTQLLRFFFGDIVNKFRSLA